MRSSKTCLERVFEKTVSALFVTRITGDESQKDIQPRSTILENNVFYEFIVRCNASIIYNICHSLAIFFSIEIEFFECFNLKFRL